MDVSFDGVRWAEHSLHTSSFPTDQFSLLPSHSSKSEYLLIPGFLDVHVHFREPGFSYKETILTGTMSAARGGYTKVCAMPNLNPAPDCLEHVKMQQDLIDAQAIVHVYPYGCITKGQKGEGDLCDFPSLKDKVIAFSDDGKGVQREELMRSAMQEIAKVDGMLVAHCEDESLLTPGGAIHEGEFAKKHGIKGISSATEYAQIARDVKLSKETGCRYHVCHISTKESVEIIRQAKKEGVDVTCETAPHYLLLNEGDMQLDGRFKMNPPIRTKADQEALLEGLIDGTIDMIATDHAPHSVEEKSKGLANSAMGIVGLETAFPLLYTGLVMKNIITLERLLEAMILTPHKRFRLPLCDVLSDKAEEFSIFDLSTKTIINPDDFLTKGRATPFTGHEVNGECLYTYCGGKVAWQK